MKIYIVSREIPLARHILVILRDKNTGVEEFRRYMRIAGIVLGVSISRSLSWSEKEVVTPLEAKAVELKPSRSLTIVGILGAAIPLVEGILEVYPWADVGLIAAKRREKPGGVSVEVFYARLPKSIGGEAVIVDPMLATGKTIEASISLVKSKSAGKVIVASVIASEPGIEYLSKRHKDVEIHALAVDPRLDEKYFIVPGLGDAGDRALGVKF